MTSWPFFNFIRCLLLLHGTLPALELIICPNVSNKCATEILSKCLQITINVPFQDYNFFLDFFHAYCFLLGLIVILEF